MEAEERKWNLADISSHFKSDLKLDIHALLSTYSGTDVTETSDTQHGCSEQNMQIKAFQSKFLETKWLISLRREIFLLRVMRCSVFEKAAKRLEVATFLGNDMLYITF